MLLLLNRRCPVLATVLSVAAGVTFIIIWVATARSAMMAMGGILPCPLERPDRSPPPA